MSASLRVLLFEYFNSSASHAFDQHELRRAGSEMLFALIDDLCSNDAMHLTVVLDARAQQQRQQLEMRGVKVVLAQRDYINQLSTLFESNDAFLAIAPEQDDILYHLTRACEHSNSSCVLLGSTADAVKLASSKQATAQRLCRHGVRTIPTYCAADMLTGNHSLPLPWVLKPDKGFASQGIQLIHHPHELKQCELSQWIIQPYVHGRHASMSLMCYHKQTSMLAANLQNIKEQDNTLLYESSCIAALSMNELQLAPLVEKIRQAIPGLYGHVGVDFIIEPDRSITIVEINPRLTSSYVGLSAACQHDLGASFHRLYCDDSLPAR